MFSSDAWGEVSWSAEPAQQLAPQKASFLPCPILFSAGPDARVPFSEGIKSVKEQPLCSFFSPD